MKIQVLNVKLAVCKVADIPSEFDKNKLFFVANTDEEISLVCTEDSLPQNALEISLDWRAFRVSGVLDFSLIGILADIATLLAKNNISIFAISTFNTDYILTKAAKFDKAIELLKNSGYEIE